VIGWYIHHHGRGHAHRAGAVAAALGGRCVVTGLSSAPQPAGWSGPWVRLGRDDEPTSPVDPSAGGVLHWAPLGDSGLRERMAAMVAWVHQHRPQFVVVDASVEVTLLLRLLGVPIVVVAALGDRLDRPHRAAYDCAAHLLTPWPEWVAPVGWPAHWTAKTTAVGAFSRYDGRPAVRVVPGTVTVLWGAGGVDVTSDQLAEAVRATPAWRWTVLGGRVALPTELGVHQPGWVADPWPLLTSAQVVITHAGQNAVAEVAAARRPAVVLAQQRPHGEQHATAAVLASAGLAHAPSAWPAPGQWPAVLAGTAARDGTLWQRWNPGDGAGRAARAVLAAVSCVPA